MFDPSAVNLCFSVPPPPTFFLGKVHYISGALRLSFAELLVIKRLELLSQ